MPKRKGNKQYSKIKKEFKEKGVDFYGYPHRVHRVKGKKKKLSEISRIRQSNRAREMDREINQLI